MDFNATIDLIIKDLEETRIIIDDLKKYPGVPAIQIELAKTKCRSAGELMAFLKNTKITDIQKIEEPVIIPQPKEIIEANPPVNILTAEEEITVKEQHLDAEPVEELRKKGDSAILADKFSHLSNRINEQLGAGKSSDTFKEPVPSKPIGKLTEAIGINDKFFFTREIFRNNNDSYSQAITKLDNVTSLEDAKAVIMSYTENNNENEAVKQLLELVKRKLPSNE
jgi:hypothetical protein